MGLRVPPAASRLAALSALEGAAWGRTRAITHLLVLALATAIAVPEPAVTPAFVWAYPAIGVALLALTGSYRRRVHEELLDSLARIAGACVVAAAVLSSGVVWAGGDPTASVVIGGVLLWSLPMALAAHVALVRVRTALHGAGHAGRRTLIVGAGAVGATVARRLAERPRLGLDVVGFLDAAPLPASRVGGRDLPVLGSPDDLAWIAAEHDVDQVVIAFSTQSDEELAGIARNCRRIGIDVALVPRMFEAIDARSPIDWVGGVPVLSVTSAGPSDFRFAVKHLFDRTVAAAALIVLGPLMAALALMVKLGSPGPVLYQQMRVGRDGREFGVLKFRSMRPATPEEEAAFKPAAGSAPGGVEGVDRRTRIGKIMRKTSLDELPQLLNVLRGDMSLVGPRPERPDYVREFVDEHRRYDERHRVKAGITGWAQVEGLRGQTSIADRVELDNAYIENWSLGLDLKILLRTFTALKSEG